MDEKTDLVYVTKLWLWDWNVWDQYSIGQIKGLERGNCSSLKVFFLSLQTSCPFKCQSQMVVSSDGHLRPREDSLVTTHLFSLPFSLSLTQPDLSVTCFFFFSPNDSQLPDFWPSKKSDRRIGSSCHILGGHFKDRHRLYSSWLKTVDLTVPFGEVTKRLSDLLDDLQV